MTSGRLCLLVVAVLCAWSPLAAQNEDPTVVVRQFFPPSLIAEDDPGNERGKQCYSTLESEGQGSPTVILAAYTYRTQAKVRVLGKNSTGWTILAEPVDEEYGAGSACEIALIDLDGDGRKEAHVHFAGWRVGGQDWIYSWSNGQLIGLTPTTAFHSLAGRRTSNVVNASFLDLDGDGRLEMFSFNPPPRDPSDPYAPSQIYRLSATGEYVMDRAVVGLWEFDRGTETPTTDVESVRLPTGAVGPFVLRVVNGAGASGMGTRVENAIESGRVWLNGQELIQPNDFGNNVAVIERTVNLQAENELKVRLAGAPGGRIAIVIQAVSPQ